MSGTTTALGPNYYPVWNGGRRLRMLRHLVGTTTKYGMVEDIRDRYGTWSELLPNAMTGEVETVTLLDLRILWGWDGSIANLPSCGLRIEQDNIWFWYIERRLDSFKKNVYNFYKSDKKETDDNWDKTMRNWMVDVEQINRREIFHSDQKLLVLPPNNSTFWLKEFSTIYSSLLIDFSTRDPPTWPHSILLD